MNPVRHTKKIFALVLSIILCLNVFMLSVCAKNLDTGVAATLNTNKLSVSDTAQTVTLTIAMLNDITTDGIGGDLYCPDGWTLTSISSSLPNFNASCYNLEAKRFGWHTEDAENTTVKEILTAVFTIPANTAANTYEIGVKDLEITSDYGTIYEDAAALAASATLTISPAPVHVTGVTLNKEETSMLVGATETLTATVSPENADNKNITWSTSNASVATVNNGVVTAVGVGTATITVTTEDGSFTASCTVTVTAAPVAVTGVTLNKNKTSMLVGGAETLTATVLPANADNKAVTWSTSNARVATVADGVVTAVGTGTATITVTTDDGGFTASCTVTVSAVPVAVTGVTLSETKLELPAGTTYTLSAAVQPANATNQNVTWTSSNPSIATVDALGRVTALTEGTVRITATTADGGFTASCTVTVTKNLSDAGLAAIIGALGNGSLPFTDVTVRDYYYDSVKWAVDKGITSGTSRYTFSPDAPCTRAQTVTFLWRAAGSPKPVGTNNPFTDVHANDYFYQAVLWAVENNITTGTTATTFSPDATVTRAQVVTFLWRANGKPAAGNSGFADVSASEYYAAAVNWAVSQRITTGTSFGVFSPDAACTRAQIVTFLYRSAK